MLWKAIVLINLLFLTACNNLNPTASELNSSSKYPATSYGNNLKVCLEGQSLYCNFNELSQEDKLKIVNADSPYSSVQNTNSVSTRQVKSISNAKQVQKNSYSNIKKNPSSYGEPACAETSCYGDISNITGRPKTHYVHGYYRKDGTYVGSYYRS